MKCIWCDKPVSGGIDTYGDWDQPFCFACWCEFEKQETTSFYGVAPRDVPPPVDGWSDLGDWMYKQDEEGPGAGVYVHKSQWGLVEL